MARGSQPTKEESDTGEPTRLVLTERKEAKKEKQQGKTAERCQRECNQRLIGKEDDSGKKIFCTEKCWKENRHPGRCAFSRCCTQEEWKQGLVDRGEHIVPEEERYTEDIVEEYEKKPIEDIVKEYVRRKRNRE